MPDGDDASGCGAGYDVPQIEVSDRHRQVQAAAFALLVETDRPTSQRRIAERAELNGSEVERLLEDFDTVGRVRFDAAGHVVGIAGLSIEPTRHRLELDGSDAVVFMADGYGTDSVVETWWSRHV